MGLTLIVTNAGRAALVNAANTGTAPVTVSQVGLTGTAVTPDATATALPGEFKRIATLSGDVVADDTIHLIVRDESSDVFTVRSLALYLADGTLFAIYGQADVLLEKSAQALMLLAIDVQFADVDATDLTFGDANFLNPPATTEVQGVVELATLAEAVAGTDTGRVPAAKMVKDAVYSWLDSRFGLNNSGIWHPANDGAGSGLDADTVDGVQASEFIRQNVGGRPISYNNGGGRLEIKGDAGGWSTGLRILGSGGGELGGFGGYGGGDTLTFLYAGPSFDALNGLRIYADRPAWGGSTIWHAGNDGAGSGLDADLLDGQHGSYYTDIVGRLGYTPLNATSYTAPDVKAKLLSVDGSGSGLDADLLDGIEASGFARLNQANAFTSAGINSFSGTVESLVDLGFKLSSASPYIGFYKADRVSRAGYIQAQSATGLITFHNDTDGATTNIRTTGGGAVQANGNTIWHAGNDGSGSGLDADTVDGAELSDLVRLNYGARPFSIDYNGALYVSGSGGGGWSVGYQFKGSAGTVLGGFGALGNTDNLSYFWMGPAYNDIHSIRIYPTYPAWGANVIWHAGNDGAGSGLDADLLDGQQSSYYTDIVARLGYTPLNTTSYTAADLKTKLLTVDGAGSGMDADLLDGQQGSYYLAASGYTAADVKAKLLTVDGAGSGIDADLLDGMHASALLPTGSLNATGYCSLPNGLIFQWGTVSCAANAYGSITFPIAFDVACFYIDSGVATEVGNADAQANGPQPYSASKTGADLWNAAPAATAWWMAIGK